MEALATMPRYESYKDSGVEWLGEIPSTWQVKKFKYLLDEINVRSKTGNELLLSLSKYHGVIPKGTLDERSGGAETLVGYKKVFIGDLVINKMQAVNGLLSISKISGITSPDYSVYRSKDLDCLDNRYLGYLLLQPEYIGEFKKRVTGVMEGFIRLYTDDLYDIYSLLPDIIQQRRIADFLDLKTAQIDEAIAIKEKQIELLKERKQLIIQKAVTQGLDPNVPMKESGVDWIGEIPEHWEATKLKHLFSENTVRTKTGTETLLSLRMELGLVPHNDVSDKFIPSESLVDYKVVVDGQLVMNRMRAAIGIFGVAQRKGLVSPDYAVFDVIGKVLPKYYLTLFKLPLMGTQFRLNSKGMGTGSSGFMRLYTENFGVIKVPNPPVEEQHKLMDFITQTENETSSSVQLLQNQIDKIKEYKTTLINSAVTGKIKVS